MNIWFRAKFFILCKSSLNDNCGIIEYIIELGVLFLIKFYYRFFWKFQCCEILEIQLIIIKFMNFWRFIHKICNFVLSVDCFKSHNSNIKIFIWSISKIKIFHWSIINNYIWFINIKIFRMFFFLTSLFSLSSSIFSF